MSPEPPMTLQIAACTSTTDHDDNLLDKIWTVSYLIRPTTRLEVICKRYPRFPLRYTYTTCETRASCSLGAGSARPLVLRPSLSPPDQVACRAGCDRGNAAAEPANVTSRGLWPIREDHVLRQGRFGSRTGAGRRRRAPLSGVGCGGRAG